MSKLLNMMGAAIGYLCAATAMAQCLLLAWMWQKGMINSEKREKMAAIAYGFDISQWENPAVTKDKRSAPRSERELYQQRITAPPILSERKRATSRVIEELRGASELLQIDRQSHEHLTKSFSDYLDKLDQTLEANAINELRVTFEVLPPKQSKDLILEMLADDDAEEAMSDLLRVLRSMPPERSKKILAEFKNEDEAAKLHRILVELGDLAERPVSVRRK